MTEKEKTAQALFERGYNCAQAVFAAFCDELDMSFEDALKISSSFGGGMGRLREVCGAVTSLFAIAGIKCGYSDPDDDAGKARHYELIQDLAASFKEAHDSIICRELLDLDEGPQSPVPEPRSAKYYEERPCAKYVADAAKLAEELINNLSKEI